MPHSRCGQQGTVPHNSRLLTRWLKVEASLGRRRCHKTANSQHSGLTLSPTDQLCTPSLSVEAFRLCCVGCVIRKSRRDLGLHITICKAVIMTIGIVSILRTFVSKIAATSMLLIQVALALKAGTDTLWPVAISGLFIVIFVARVVNRVVHIAIRIVGPTVVRAMAREVSGVVPIVVVEGMVVFRIVSGHRLLASWLVTAWAGFERAITVCFVRCQWPELLRPECVLVLVLGRAGGIIWQHGQRKAAPGVAVVLRRPLVTQAGN